jgi:acyl-CoA thioester hydrolase
MNYRHKSAVQVRFRDTDLLGHVNNAVYLTFMELARMSYFREVLSDLVNWDKEGIIVAKAAVEFKRPLFLDDEIFIYTKISHLSARSFNMIYRVVKQTKEGETVVAEGSTLMVCYDYRNSRSIVMPESWRQRITEYESAELNP